jgi:hypothetical protein
MLKTRVKNKLSTLYVLKMLEISVFLGVLLIFRCWKLVHFLFLCEKFCFQILQFQQIFNIRNLSNLWFFRHLDVFLQIFAAIPSRKSGVYFSCILEKTSIFVVFSDLDYHRRVLDPLK